MLFVSLIYCVSLSIRIEIKNLGGGKHQLIFNKLEMEDEGEILCESGKLTSSCKLTVKKGESKPTIECPDEFNGPADRPFVIEVPYKSMYIDLIYFYCISSVRNLVYIF